MHIQMRLSAAANRNSEASRVGTENAPESTLDVDQSSTLTTSWSRINGPSSAECSPASIFVPSLQMCAGQALANLPRGNPFRSILTDQ